MKQRHKPKCLADLSISFSSLPASPSKDRPKGLHWFLFYFCRHNHCVQPMSVQIKQLSKLYGDQKALDAISLSVESGEIVGLLGPNGAGKSTLMKIISCFIPPTSGVATVMGYDVQQASVEVRRLIGYLPENNPLYLDMYIKEYLMFVAGVHGLGSQAAARVNQMIELTGLGDEMHKKIRMLSKGYKQRVGLAQALIPDPRVLILDEPTSGLDPNQLVDIRQLIRDIGKDKTVILSTHIMQEVEALCSRVAILNKGKLVAYKPIDQLMTESEEVHLSVEFKPQPRRESLLTIKGIKDCFQQDDVWVLSSEAGIDIRDNLNLWAKENGYSILSLSRKHIRMEESFHRLTGKNT